MSEGLAFSESWGSFIGGMTCKRYLDVVGLRFWGEVADGDGERRRRSEELANGLEGYDGGVINVVVG